MDRRTTFNSIISDYEDARPGYPNNLFNDVIEFSQLTIHDNVLEVGSGTGQATEYFIKNHYSITGLEIGSKQVEYLSEKYAQYPDFKCVCSPFEEYQSNNNSYKLIISATAFHWIEADMGYPKAYNLLQNQGAIAVFWHMSPITKHETEMFIEIRNIYQKYAPEIDQAKSQKEVQEIHNKRISQIQTCNLFGQPICKTYSWTDEYTAERYVKLLNTFSSFQVLDNSKRNIVLYEVADYINSKGGSIYVPQEVRLYMSRK